MIKSRNDNGNGNGRGNGHNGARPPSGNGDSFQSLVIRELRSLGEGFVSLRDGLETLNERFASFAEAQGRANAVFLQNFKHQQHRLDSMERRADVRERRQDKIDRILVKELQALRRERNR